MRTTEIGIMSRYGKILYKGQHPTLKEAIEFCVEHHIRLDDADLRGADLRHANLDGWEVSGADLRDADLCGANMSETLMSHCDFSGSRLTDACLCYADLVHCRFENCDLTRSDFSEARVDFSVFPDPANLSRAHSATGITRDTHQKIVKNKQTKTSEIPTDKIKTLPAIFQKMQIYIIKTMNILLDMMLRHINIPAKTHDQK